MLRNILGTAYITDETLKARLIEILKDNAQVAWIRNLMSYYGAGKLPQGLINALCRQTLCDKAQVLLIKDRLHWAECYYSQYRLSCGAFYKMVSDSKYHYILETQISKYSISREKYEVLLLSPNKDLAILAKNLIH